MDENRIEENNENIVEKVLGEEPKADMSWSERLVGIFFSPGRTFKDIAKKHDWGLMPLIIMIIVGLAVNGAVLMTHDVDSMMINQFEDSGRMGDIPDEQLDSILNVSIMVTKIMMTGGVVLLTPLMFAFMAFLFLIIFKLFSSEATFGQSFSVVCYSWFVSVIKSLLFLILIFFRKLRTFEEMAYFVKTNIASFIDPASISKPLFALLASIDIFTIWILVLMSMGLSVITKKSPYMTGAVVFTLWLLFVVLKVGGAFLGTMAG